MVTTDYMRIYQEDESLKTILSIYTIEFFIKFASYASYYPINHCLSIIYILNLLQFSFTTPSFCFIDPS